MKTLKLDPTLQQILINQSTNQFTVTEIRDLLISAYEQSTGKVLDSIEARKWVYRRIYKLAGLGYLEKVYSENDSLLGYKIASKFMEIKIKNTNSLSKLRVSVPSFPSNVDSNKNILKSLNEKAKKYQVDLNASIGETEEYKALYESYPSLKSELEAQYELSRDKSSKLLGQLTATKKIIAQISLESD